jgi:tetratricopeptide (TPR) repeat protein
MSPVPGLRLKAALAVASALAAGCARSRPAEKAPPETDVAYASRGSKVIERTAGGAVNAGGAGAPVGPAFPAVGLRVPTSGPGAALPAFGAEPTIPAALPAFIGSAIPGSDGRAPQTADKLVLLALLKARRFPDLERCFEDFQTAFELDWKKEYWPSDALDAFRTGDAEIGALVGDWAAASPKSWAAVAARGVHRSALGWLVRGSGFADSVPAENRRELERQQAAADGDLRTAIGKRPRFVAAHYVLLEMLRGRAEARPVLEQALKACPECFQPRSAYLDGLSPDWGGSYERMDAFVREALASDPNVRLRLLRGFVPHARAAAALRAGTPGEAFALENQALESGEHWAFLLRRAVVASRLGQLAAALADLDRAFELRPQSAPLADFRAQVRAHAGQIEGAVADFDLARRLDPSRPRPERYARIADTLVRRSNDALASGGTERAEALRALANNLKVAAAAPGVTAPPADAAPPAPTAPAYADVAAAFHARLAELPDDYAAYRRLALPLLNARRSDELDELWTAWIQRHPDDARGYFERCAADSQKRDVARGDEDLRQACALGHAGACRTQEINAAVRGRTGGAP